MSSCLEGDGNVICPEGVVEYICAEGTIVVEGLYEFSILTLVAITTGLSQIRTVDHIPAVFRGELVNQIIELSGKSWVRTATLESARERLSTPT